MEPPWIASSSNLFGSNDSNGSNLFGSNDSNASNDSNWPHRTTKVLTLLSKIPPNKMAGVLKLLTDKEHLAFLYYRCLCRASNAGDDPELAPLLRKVDKLASVYGASSAKEARQHAFGCWARSGVKWANDNVFLNRVVEKSFAGRLVMADKQLKSQCLRWFKAQGYFAQKVVAFAVTAVVGAEQCTSAQEMSYVLHHAFAGAGLVDALKDDNEELLVKSRSSAAADLAVSVFALIAGKFSATAIAVV